MHQQELLKGNTETLLLSLLELEPMYGYQIVKEMNQRSSGYFGFKEGTLYPALHRLERDNLVEGLWQDTPNGVARRYYRADNTVLHRTHGGPQAASVDRRPCQIGVPDHRADSCPDPPHPADFRNVRFEPDGGDYRVTGS